MTQRQRALIFLSLVAAVISVTGVAHAMMGGRPARADSRLANQVAFIQGYGPDGESRCTGTFISERIVLTAAHCLVLAHPNRIRVSLGTNPTASPKFVTWATRFVVPRDVDLFDDDVALLLTRDPVPSKNHVTTLASANPPPASKFIAAGFGRQTDAPDFLEDAFMAPTLQFGVFTTREDVRAQNAKHIYAWTFEGFSPARGDSGGPMFIHQRGKLVQAGVISTVTEDENVRGLITLDYASAAKQRSWIDHAMIKLNAEKNESLLTKVLRIVRY